ncbi:hypothetical protein KFL_002160110 [Klebsormidium nitens]|uniref:Amine oxidase domain-containing protein n=1 Tax=Klebsormidium nitens TaxID=105231 RepID=A0A1Y1I781_KLENI|nr:hypothetical protein KFL_002160110 [Klebsormidium nitens]|eukprot:GAQ85001.1 hypothetical protein KFL_002160110 [Klebsormidium nitens]
MSSRTPIVSMKVAIVGAGISGLSAASVLAKAGHRVTIFEKSAQLGGHARTVLVDGTPVDVGFQLLNRQVGDCVQLQFVNYATTYPTLVRFLGEYQVELEPSPLTFAFDFTDTPAQGPSSADLALFAEDALSFLEAAPQPEVTLGHFLEGGGYSAAFQRGYLVPVCAAVWFTSKEAILGASAYTVLSFLRDHKMLQASGRLDWLTVKGRTQTYISKVVSSLKEHGVQILTNSPVAAIERTAAGVTITANGVSATFDKLVLATHAPDALALLGEGATPAEKAVLGAFTYNKSTLVLHRDAALMPADRATWGAWNFVGSAAGASSVTYWLNKLQHLERAAPLFLTINPHVPPRHVVDGDYPWLHQGPHPDAAAANAHVAQLQGGNNTWFAGAYQGFGFHEDGCKAGMAAALSLLGDTTPAPVAVEALPLAFKGCKPLAPIEDRLQVPVATERRIVRASYDDVRHDVQVRNALPLRSFS